MDASAINENKCISIAKYDVSAINGNVDKYSYVWMPVQ